MKECDYVTEIMPIALDGLLNDEDKARLNAHIVVCDRCRALWEAMREVSALLAQAPMSTPSPEFTGRVMARLERETLLKVRLRLGGILLFWAAYVETLAMLLMGVLLGWAIWIFPAKGLLLRLALRWLWRLGLVLESLAKVAGSFLQTLLPPATAFAIVSSGIWAVVLFFLLRRYGYARILA
ncbi:MAG TPA: hypothetical protein ENG33_08190 [Chloroflexi bacterium]|nr:hypothetical protein [Chloroflexota bacterium]